MEKYSNDFFSNLSYIQGDCLLSNAKKRLLECGINGFFKHAISHNDGGYGDNFEVLCLAHIELGKATSDAGLILSINAHIWGGIIPLIRYGSEQQKTSFLLPIINGSQIAGHAITEPQAGSHISSLLAEAKEMENGYILNCHKKYITNATIANWLIVYCKICNELSAFIVKMDDPGVKVLDTCRVDGFKTAPIGEIILKDCYIPKDRLLGKRGAGNIMIQRVLEHERVFLFAGILGIMEKKFFQILDYAKKRKLGNNTLASQQVISHMLVDMYTSIETARLWVLHCARLKDQNKSISLASSQAKLFISEAFLKFSLDAVHITGGFGLESQNGLSNFILDASASKILSGTNEIQRNIVASLIGIH